MFEYLVHSNIVGQPRSPGTGLPHPQGSSCPNMRYVWFLCTTWGLLCSSVKVMTCFLIRGYDTLPKKELHRSLQIKIVTMVLPHTRTFFGQDRGALRASFCCSSVGGLRKPKRWTTRPTAMFALPSLPPQRCYGYRYVLSGWVLGPVGTVVGIP